jgi:hypothetical protein
MKAVRQDWIRFQCAELIYNIKHDFFSDTSPVELMNIRCQPRIEYTSWRGGFEFAIPNENTIG